MKQQQIEDEEEDEVVVKTRPRIWTVSNSKGLGFQMRNATTRN